MRRDKERIEEILERAAQIPKPARLDYIKNACENDQGVIDEVVSLLETGTDKLDHFLEEGLPRILWSAARNQMEQSEMEEQQLRREQQEEKSRWEGQCIGDLYNGQGKYEILELRRFGLMASLYSARDRWLDRLVIVKIPRRDAYTKGENDDDNTENEKTNVRNNFRKEFNALRKLEACSYVVKVHDFGELPDERPFMVLEYIHGKNARELLGADGENKSGLSVKDAANIIRQAGKGLQAAHENGILHRDIKSENIMVCDDGLVKVIDFNAADLRVPKHQMSTCKDLTWGTAGYASPEHLRKILVDETVSLTSASDVYSLAVTAYELLTGELPFGDNLLEIDERQRNYSFTPVTQARKTLLNTVDDLLREALDYDPRKRLKNAKDFSEQLATALESTRSEGAPLPFPHPLPTRKGLAWVALVVLLLVGGGYLLWMISSERTTRSGPLTSTTSEKSPNEPIKPPNLSPRSFTYWLDLTRPSNGKPGALVKASGKEVFIYGDSIVMNFVSPQSGYMYLINEGRNYKDATTFYFEGKFRIRPNERVSSERLGFDNKPGVEKFWVLFSNSPINLLDEYDSPREIPEEKTEQVRNFLNKNAIPDSSAKEDIANAQTEVESSGETVAYKLDLRHRKTE